MQAIAKGVPENQVSGSYHMCFNIYNETRAQWGVLFEVSYLTIQRRLRTLSLEKEVNRVLRPGGSVEIVEDGVLCLMETRQNLKVCIFSHRHRVSTAPPLVYKCTPWAASKCDRPSS